MTREEIDALIALYPLEPNIVPDTEPYHSQFDRESAKINYALVRHFKPSTVVEFGTRGGRCTHDILKALIDNGKSYTYRPYELENDLRALAQENISRDFGELAVLIGGDITKATDIPNNIDYLFVDNYHDLETTKWVFETLIKKCVPGALVQIHDIRVGGDYQFDYEKNGWGEMQYMQDMVNSKTFPLKKLYWSWEDGTNEHSSSWWTYVPLHHASNGK